MKNPAGQGGALATRVEGSDQHFAEAPRKIQGLSSASPARTSGFFIVPRGLLDHPALGANQPLCRRAAWIWLLEHAAWRDHLANLGGRTIALRRGQIGHSMRFLAAAWHWNLAAVQRFIGRLKTDTLIDTTTDTGQTVITICNYDDYQATPGFSDTAFDTEGDTLVMQGRYACDTKENKLTKKLSNKSQEASADQTEGVAKPAPKRADKQSKGPLAKLAGFDTFWAAYPKKVAREAAKKAWASALKRADAAEILAGLGRHAFSADPQYVPHPATWLNAGRWADERPSATQRPALRPDGRPHRGPNDSEFWHPTENRWMSRREAMDAAP